MADHPQPLGPLPLAQLQEAVVVQQQLQAGKGREDTGQGRGGGGQGRGRGRVGRCVQAGRHWWASRQARRLNE